MAQLLRHGAVREGLDMQADGYVAVDELLAHRRLAGVTLADVQLVVMANDKQRFSLKTDDRGRHWVKANQGHSIPLVTELDLEPLTEAAQAPVVVHGTSRQNWRVIAASGGLHRMQRNHTHWAAGLPGGRGVISGMRSSSDVFIYLDVAAALAGGIQLFRSPNGVILTAGLDGWVPLRFFDRVVDRDGAVLPFDRTKVVAPAPPTTTPRRQRGPRNPREAHDGDARARDPPE